MAFMCGRFVMSRATSDLLAAFDAKEAAGDEPRPSWNVAPTQPVRIVTDRLDQETGEISRNLETARWGLVPSWAKDASGAARLINARSETVLDKPSFRTAAIKRRALVVAEGYYEWEKQGPTKIPTYLRPSHDGALLAFAGLYEFWRDMTLPDDNAWLMTTTILTRPAADAIGHIHDRTPVIVPQDSWKEWLDPGLTAKDDVRSLIDSIPDPHLVPVVVGPAVGNVGNDGPELINPA